MILPQIDFKRSLSLHKDEHKDYPERVYIVLEKYTFMRIYLMFIPEHFSPEEKADFTVFINFMLEKLEKYGDKIQEDVKNPDNQTLTPQ